MIPLCDRRHCRPSGLNEPQRTQTSFRRFRMRIKIGALTAAAATLALVASLAWTQTPPQPGQQRHYPEGDPNQSFVLQGSTVMATAAKLRKDTGNASDVYL